MAKLTLSGLQSFVASYVLAAKQAAAWSATTANTIGLLDKVGKIITIDGEFNDKLPEFNGDDLPLGKTIEEYFIDLTLPEAFDNTGANALAPARPSVESVSYSYTLGRKKIKTTETYDDVERASLTAEGASNIISKIMERLYNSQTLYEYQCKKQLLGNMITKAYAATNAATLITSIAMPSDSTTGEAFLKRVKGDIENASFSTEGNNLGNYLIGKAPKVNLYFQKGVMPSLEVDTFAGAFHREDLALPVDIKVLDDFGTIKNASNVDVSSNVYAVLLDIRGIKLHTGYRAVRSQENGDGDFINFFYHSEFTGFISKSTYIHVYVKP